MPYLLVEEPTKMLKKTFTDNIISISINHWFTCIFYSFIAKNNLNCFVIYLYYQLCKTLATSCITSFYKLRNITSIDDCLSYGSNSADILLKLILVQDVTNLGQQFCNSVIVLQWRTLKRFIILQCKFL